MKKTIEQSNQEKKIRIFTSYWMDWIPQIGRSDYQDEKVLEQIKDYKPFSLGISSKNV